MFLVLYIFVYFPISNRLQTNFALLCFLCTAEEVFMLDCPQESLLTYKLLTSTKIVILLVKLNKRKY